MKPFQPEDFLVLVVDDISQNLQVLGEMLERVGYESTFATNGIQALARIEGSRPDLILMDLMMPGMNGLEVCQKIKTNPELLEIPVIFITASNEKEHLLQAFERGAVDYVTKPFNPPELLARVRTHLELKHTRDQLRESLQQQSRLIRELELLATTDTLTSINNRRHLFVLAEKEIQQADIYQYDFSVLMIDIDHFKQINDTYGHDTGDEVLKTVAQTMLSCLRQDDHIGRFGGEEFVILLPKTDLLKAVNLAEQIRERIAQIKMDFNEEKNIKITVSIGVSQYKDKNETIDTILKRADQRLYQAKKQGRNRVQSK